MRAIKGRAQGVRERAPQMPWAMEGQGRVAVGRWREGEEFELPPAMMLQQSCPLTVKAVAMNPCLNYFCPPVLPPPTSPGARASHR